MSTALAFPSVFVVVETILKIQVLIATIAIPVDAWKSTHAELPYS